MRSFLVSLMAASMLVPAAASAQDGGPRGVRAQEERGSQRETRANARPQRAERAQRVERAERADHAPQKVERAPRIEQSNNVERAVPSDRMPRSERPSRADRAQIDAQPVEQAPTVAPAQPATQPNGKPSMADTFRQMGRNMAAHGDDDHQGDNDHQGDDRDWHGDKGHGHDWSRDWRKNHRYDWHHHRSRHRSLFRLGYYYDPYGWGYRRWSIGYSMWPSYYGSGFWLNDPWMYRLPPAYGPYRWVRYYNDALLVNIYTGQVVDVIYNFFW